MVKNPLVIVGGLQPKERPAVFSFLRRCPCPIFAEATSGFRENKELMDRLVLSGEALLSEVPFDGVIRIGTVPVLRYWRDLEHRNLPVQVFSRLAFSGLGRPNVEVQPIAALENVEIGTDQKGCKAFLQKDRERYSQRLEKWKSEPTSERGMFYQLSKLIPKESRIFLGNSLAIREWDLCATREDRNFEVAANRGANGIDGELSTFYGWAQGGKSNWAILGDLTTLYDLSAPWILPQLRGVETNVVVMNNGGGQLFSKLFQSEIFLNRHQLNFKHWAAMWNLHYVIARSASDAAIPQSASHHRLIEILPGENTISDQPT